MKKETLFVAKDKCPLDVIAELGELTANSWIFLHRSALDKLINSANYITNVSAYKMLEWSKTDNYPKTVVKTLNLSSAIWIRVHSIDAANIAFKICSSAPDYIFFIAMEE